VRGGTGGGMQRQSHLIGLLVLAIGCDDAADDDASPSCPVAEIGESCSDIACVEGAECDFADYQCKEASGIGEPCSPVGCAEGLGCDVGGCAALPGPGEPCKGLGCGVDLFCLVDPIDPTIRTCTELIEVDGACSGHSQCASNYCPAGFCKPPPVEGEPCFGPCAEGFTCNSGNTCVEIVGMSCDPD
jgi:hypothetical protein